MERSFISLSFGSNFLGIPQKIKAEMKNMLKTDELSNRHFHHIANIWFQFWIYILEEEIHTLRLDQKNCGVHVVFTNYNGSKFDKKFQIFINVR